MTTCAVDGCEKPAHAKGWCSTHYGSVRRHGDPLAGRRHRSRLHAAPPCAVDGCDEPRRKFDWCQRHAALAKRNGMPQGKYEWPAKREDCAACGDPVPQGQRQFCSDACQRAASRSDWKARTCVQCGALLDVSRVSGRFTPGSRSWVCDECRRPRRHTRDYAVMLLAHYRGTDCGICGEPVDLTVRFPDRRCASVDHTVPVALGGADDGANLQLAHFGCNARKNALQLARTEAAV